MRMQMAMVSCAHNLHIALGDTALLIQLECVNAAGRLGRVEERTRQTSMNVAT